MFRPHRHTTGRTHTVTLGILAAGLLSTSVQAADAPDPFMLVAYSNRTGGRDLAGGDYAGATRALVHGSGAAQLDPAALETNRCVAYAMTQQFTTARAACDAAVQALQADEGASALGAQNPRQVRAAAALAYSNRAVLHWLSADPAAARKDMARARALAPQADFVRHNLQAMQGHTDVPSPAIRVLTAGAP
jgi:hypothetical protein